METEPSDRAVVANSPDVISLRFNEPIDHALTIITLYDWNAKPVFTGNPDGDIERSPLLEFSLPELKPGTYTVKWNIVSADGHPASGTYVFSVGEATLGDVKTVEDNGGADAGLIFARGLTEGLILLAAGLIWFSWLAERAQFPGVQSLLGKGQIIAMFVLFLGTAGEMIAYTWALPPGILQVMMNGRWDLLTEFPFILMLFGQVLLLLLLVIPGMVRGWYLTLWFALAAVPAFGGHIWGMESPLIAVIPRILHQLTIALWLGALLYVILLLIWQKKQNEMVSWSKFRPFFVNKMMLASGLVLLSGVVMVYLQTGITSVFTNWGTWSTTAAVKVFLTLLMLGLAIFQTLKWKKTETFTTGRWIRSEWVLGLIAIVFGVWMSQIAYPVAVKSYDKQLVTDGAEADVHISKLQAGDQEMIAAPSDVNGESPKEVALKLSMPQHNMDGQTKSTIQDNEGNYYLSLPFPMAGEWILELTATYPDGSKVVWKDEVFIVGKGN